MRVVTLDEVMSTLSAEPQTGKTHEITLDRIRNVESILSMEVLVGDVSDESKKNGEPLKLAGITSAYKKIIADKKCGDKVTVTHAKVAGKVFLAATEKWAEKVTAHLAEADAKLAADAAALKSDAGR